MTTDMTALEKARDFAQSGNWQEAAVWATIAQAELMEKRATSFSSGAITISAEPGHSSDAIALAVLDNIARHNGAQSAEPLSPVLNKFVEEARAIANIHIETMNMRRAARIAPLAEDIQRTRQAIDNYRQLLLEYNEAVNNTELRALATASAGAKDTPIIGGQGAK